jgi:hypothetical protein
MPKTTTRTVKMTILLATLEPFMAVPSHVC